MTDVQICNMALGRIKAQPISDLVSDRTKSATTCRIFYEPIRDALLRGHPWAFAVTRRQLAVASIDNLTTYEYAYMLPTDPKCLRILNVLASSINPSVLPYEKEEKYLYSSEPAAILMYIGQVVDPNQFDALFVDAFAWRLASELAGPVNGESSAEPWAKYERIMTQAWGTDAQEKIEAAVPASQWEVERFR